MREHPRRTWVMTGLKVRCETEKFWFRWEVRPTRFLRVGPLDIISEATIALERSDRIPWQIYQYRVRKAVTDASLSKAALALEIPDENVKLLDRTTGEVRFTDERGVVIHEEHKTPQQMEADRRALAETMTRSFESSKLLSQRRAYFYSIIGAAFSICVLLGVWCWRRRRRLSLG